MKKTLFEKVTRRFVIGMTIAVLLCSGISPVLTYAQDRPMFGTGFDSNQSHWWGRWEGGGELSQKVSTLPSVANPSVSMPVLFGVGLKNIFPNFGDPRDGGARTHEGEDIMAVKGTPIVSPTQAVVLKTGVGASEGNYVYTANPGNETFVYMHLDRIGEGVVPGTMLTAGDLIGYVGNTGNAAGGAAHLHFEIHDSSGAPTNPFPRLTNEFSPAEKMADLTKIFAQTSDPSGLAQFLVSNFRSTFTSAVTTGIVMPTQIAGLLGTVISTPTSTLPTTASSSRTPSALSRNLTLYSRGEDVRLLQKLLNEKGYSVALSGAGSKGNETTYFGPATRVAVIKFQLAQHIAPAVGYVGPLTRAALI